MAWIDVPPTERAALAQRLSDRQLHVYILRLGGYSWQRISDDCRLQIRTVRTHYQAAKVIHAQVIDELKQEAA